MGKGEGSTCKVHNLREGVHSEKVIKSKTLWGHRVSEEEWGELCATSLGLMHESERLKAIGNGQSAIVAASAWEILSRRAYENRNASTV